jgi:hypothetical protein
MAKEIVIDNQKFDFNTGVRLLKLKHTECPFEQLSDFWDEIVPLTFKDIAQFENLEKRRIGINYLGLERLIESVKPTLVESKTLKKSTSWIDANGELVEHEYDDTYELYSVSKDYFNEGITGWNKMREDVYYVKCKDTSTDREYLIWVDADSVNLTNGGSRWDTSNEHLNAINAIAWTIQVDVAKGDIDKIIRQGDCILVKPKPDAEMLNSPRHLTGEEYLSLIVAES